MVGSSPNVGHVLHIANTNTTKSAVVVTRVNDYAFEFKLRLKLVCVCVRVGNHIVDFSPLIVDFSPLEARACCIPTLHLPTLIYTSIMIPFMLFAVERVDFSLALS